MCKHKKAFTLIELLVVIAIIALLLSIIMPALRKAREHSKMLVCKSNQRSILQAVSVYSTNNHNRLPPTIQGRADGWRTIPMRLKYYYGTDVALSGGSVIEILGSYMESPEYFDCPVSGHDPDWQEAYISGANSQTVQFLNCSYFLFWNWTKFENESPSFKPTDAGGDNLMTCDVIFYNEPQNNQAHGGKMWVSSHRWTGAGKLPMMDAISGGTLNESFTFWMKDDQSGNNIPEMNLNAGYKDCHVETIRMADFVNIDDIYWLPQKRR